MTVQIVGTGITTTAQADKAGNFVVPALPFGNYVVAATASGFGKAPSGPLALSVNSDVNLVVKLPLGTGHEEVTATGTPSTVNTSSSTSGSTLSSNQIANLPIDGRDVMNFLEITPGSVWSTGIFQGSINYNTVWHEVHNRMANFDGENGHSWTRKS